MNTIEFTELQTNGWINKNDIKLYIDYKRNNVNNQESNTILSTLTISEYIKCDICKIKNKETKTTKIKQDQKYSVLDNTPLLQEETLKTLILKNKYILVINNEVISTLPLELRNIDRILPLIKLFIQDKLKYEITLYQNYLTLNLQYRLYNILNKVSFHLLNSKIYECFLLYNSLSSMLLIYKADMIKQNEFEHIRQQLLLLDDLGPYNNLKKKLENKLHVATPYKDDNDSDDKWCC
jgi:curved DNA-binding protein CbpA